jgi:hypothetical protein
MTLAAIRCDSSLPALFSSHFVSDAIFVDEFALLRTGFLDTFDPFDSSCAELPGDFLDLA